ncbi:hypothetical protein AB0I81_62765 [Nonomuraea sp. NPDC050404]|uniref:hypothetical protein n=1 Tax=Nonomuraea sp. NPDC050404 TaxID=3155783 RepID=UPI0033D20515
MMDASADVRVSDHAFGLLDGGDIPIETADYANGLVTGAQSQERHHQYHQPGRTDEHADHAGPLIQAPECQC